MTLIRNATIWITGASSGIGEALASEAAATGAKKLILSARRQSELERVRATCANADAHAIETLDLADVDNLEAKAREVWQRHGPIDIVIHSGGISQRSLCENTQLDVYRRLMDVNFFGTVAITQALLPLMLAQKKGHIVAISSLVGKFGTPLRSGYAASKHALHGYTDALRAEVADRNVHVMIVCPGWVRTNISVTALSGDGSAHAKMDPGIDKGLCPRDVAAKILDGIEGNKAEMMIAGKEAAAVYLKRFAPGLFNTIIRRAKLT